MDFNKIALSPLQVSVVKSEMPHTVVMSSAASGKTRLLTEKVRRLLHQGFSANRIVVITFTNAAAFELRRRLGDDWNSDLRVSTIHSYANFLLVKNGIRTDYLTDNEQFDELFQLIKENPEVLEPVDFLLLDEAQDSDKLQFEFIFEYVRPKSFMIVGDPRQNIFEWNGSDPTLITNLANSKNIKTFLLNENYRNAKSILHFAKGLLGKSGLIDDSIPMRSEIGIVEKREFDMEWILEAIRNTEYYSDWFILTRTNAQLDQILGILRFNSIPCDTFRQGDLKVGEIYSRMEDNTVKVLTIHSAKGLEAKNVIVVGANPYNPEESRLCYVAATRAQDHLYWTVKPRFQKKKWKI